MSWKNVIKEEDWISTLETIAEYENEQENSLYEQVEFSISKRIFFINLLINKNGVYNNLIGRPQIVGREG